MASKGKGKGKDCSCKGHSRFSNEDSPVIPIASKKHRKGVIRYLVSEGLLETYHRNLCEGCYQHGLAKVECKEMTFTQFCLKIETNELTEDEFVQISQSYGKALKQRLEGIKCDNSLEALKNLDVEQMWECVPSGCSQFLQAISPANKGIVAINVFENLCFLCNNYFIGPLNFSKVLLTYFLSGSRRIIEINGCFSPSGSYTTVMDFLKNKAVSEQHVPEDVDFIVFFDNNQLMSRSWRVQYNSKPLVSVVTTQVCLTPPIASFLQSSADLLPGKWLSVEGLQDPKMITAHSVNLFRTMRTVFIEHEIQNIMCGAVNDNPTKRRKVTSEGEVDPYSDIESKVEGTTSVTLLHPIAVNPCSFKSLEVVLDSITTKANRAWVAIGCDGLPFNLCSKMLDNYFKCPHCDKVFEKKEMFERHVSEQGLQLCITDCKKYNNILMLPGFGHIDINVTKGLFKLLWNVCLKELALLLGWTSPKALIACEKCTDHHKATQILDILFQSCTSSLIAPFIRHCQTNSILESIENLYEFVSNQSANYIFLFKITFTYLLAWKYLKMGMRRANYDIVKMAMDKLSILFYGLNMTMYMDLWFRFDNMMLKAPPEIQTFIKKTICLSQSGHQSKAEGGDFILETANKKVKGFMPHGVPTEERWTRVCGNIDHLSKIATSLSNTSKHTDNKEPTSKSSFRHVDNKEAIHHFTERLNTYVGMDGDHVSVDGKPLDPDLINFDKKCDENKMKYYQKYPDVRKLCEKVFITPMDREIHNDIKNKTMKELIPIIQNEIQNIKDAGGEEEAEMYQTQWDTDIVKDTKAVYLAFHKELTECLELVKNRQTATEDTEEVHD